MQAIKDKFNDMRAVRKAKAEAKEEEKAEKDLAKVRVEVAHELRLAKEAEEAMDLHVNKAAEKIAKEEEKYIHKHAGGTLDPYASSFTNTQLNNAGTGPTNNLP